MIAPENCPWPLIQGSRRPVPAGALLLAGALVLAALVAWGWGS